ncbi:2og-Fe oxygenase family protein [Leptodontidium sp. MPI-SDFR-AT-0119]|nr:2og-Fe oxygenase family protein [Leptodontidium sp. MPI-SDFR-AT-0119]
MSSNHAGGTSTLVVTDSSEQHTLLRLSSANGPVYRRIKIAPLRDARSDEIPLIDISGIYSSSFDERKAVATQIHEAATNIGFFYVKNHGISASVMKSAYDSSLEFFRQPDEIKQEVNAELSPCLNGWKPPQTQRINQAESIDVRETFSFRYNPTYDPAVSGNLGAIPAEIRESLVTNEFCWEKTANLPNLKEDIINYWRATLGLARHLTRSFSLALSLPETYLDPKITYPDAGIGLNYYPSIPPSTSGLEEQVSIGSHTDFQLFTILWQDSNGGLQVLNREGEWINAAPIEGTFVINIGDYLQRITNDRYISTVHRARNLSGKERISMPMFFGFNLNETCGVLDSCVDEEHPRNYEPISCKEWVELRVKAMHTTD